MADPEVDRRLAATRDLAGRLAISGTPTFVFDNRMVRGYLPLDADARASSARSAPPTDARPAGRELGAFHAGAAPHIQTLTRERGQAAEPASKEQGAA